MFLSLITSGIVIFEAYLTYLTYQYILMSQPDKYNTLIIIQAVLFLIGLISYIFKTLIQNKTNEKIVKNLKINIVAKISLTKSLEFQTNKKGFYIAKLIEKLNYFFERRPGNLFNWIDHLNLFWISFPVLIFIDWRVGLISSAISVINIIIPIIMGHVTIKYMTLAGEEMENFDANLLMMIDSYPSFYFFNKQKEFIKETIDENNKIIKKILKNIKFNLISEFIIAGSQILAYYLIIYVMGHFILLVYEKASASVGLVAAVPVILQFLTQSIKNIGLYISQYKSVKELAIEYETSVPTTKIINSQSNYQFDHLEIRNLNFSYEDNKPLFKDLNLFFEKGKKYALIGPSGSGKSTLLNLITKQLENYQGEIILNGINVKNIDDSDYKETFIFLDSQEFVFNDTVYNNVSLWTPDQEPRAKKALDLASYSIEDLNLQLNNENSNISSGQKQRINFARFFFTRKNLLILDEALANLDKDNVANIEKNLFDNSELTLINVTHHLTNPEKYHKIYKMEDLVWK
ncbi:ABC transporter ATP-binding protein [Mycoplasmoides fastidiosum]|nr:ABC transporter ATP-binding protein [Mycoplasmoides fastidiosum]